MTAQVLYAGASASATEWRDHVSRAAADVGLEATVYADPADVAPERVEYLLLSNSGPIEDLRPYTGLKAILSLWAGVEQLVDRPDLPRDVPLARMVEPGLTIGMTDYVVGHALRAHIDVDGSIERSRARRWDDVHPPLSINRRIGVMGLGTLGQDAAEKLAALRFDVRGWSRTPKTIPGVACYAGLDGLAEFLSGAEILIILLPLTADTHGLMNAERLAQLPKGAYIINAARGPILVEEAMLAALDDRLGGATLDVFDVEPLPEDHPYWTRSTVTVTPHVASVTRPETASTEIARQILRCEQGEPLLHLVDAARGY